VVEEGLRVRHVMALLLEMIRVDRVPHSVARPPMLLLVEILELILCDVPPLSKDD
jgi:hypothetical protein